jgi:PhnB protein
MKEMTPYLIFNGNCREAMSFYQRCLGGDLRVSTYGEGDPNTPENARDRVIHARLTKGPTVLMASDNMPGMTYTAGDNYFVSLSCDRDDEVDTLFAALSTGGHAQMPPTDAPWGARFAMFSDRFGIGWMLNHERAPMK